MRTAKELYADYYNDSDGYYGGPCDYQPIIEEFGNVVLQVVQDDWQGDTWVIYQDGDRYGYLCFGWGSCSGCDALQACDTPEEVQSLMDGLHNSIKWFDSKEACWQYFHDKDWETEYSWGYDDFKRFLEEVQKLLQ